MAISKIDFDKLKKGFELYDNHFKNYEYTYLYRVGNEDKTLVVRFSKANFQHLTGLSYYRGPKKFYEDLADNRIDINNLNYDKNGFLRLKLSVIENLEMLIGDMARVSESGKFRHLSYDSLIRSNKAILAIACKGLKSFSIPISLLALRQEKIHITAYNVLEIKRQNLITKKIEKLK